MDSPFKPRRCQRETDQRRREDVPPSSGGVRPPPQACPLYSATTVVVGLGAGRAEATADACTPATSAS